MAENNQRERVTEQLRHLSIHPDVYETDRALAQRCLRLLEQPLPLTVFGTDPTYALALANLMIGRTLLPTATERANLTLMHSEDCYVDLQLPDNSYAQLEQDNFPALFQLNPTQACVYADLPVLNKLTIQIAVDHNPATLAAQAAGALLSAEIALWAGGTLTQDLAEVWSNVPAQLRAHSYLVQPPELNPAPWQAMIPEFADVIQVDPERAQRAKTRPEGVDKAAFKAAGGVQLVKTIKKEIDALTQSAMDAGEILLVRHADKLTTATAPAPQTQATASQPTAPVEPVAPDQEPAAEPTMDAQSEPDPAVETLPRADAVVLDIEIDDEGYFDPDVMAEYQRQYPDLDRKIAHLYTRGASMKAIQQEIQDQQGVFVSVNLILVAAATVTELYSDSSDPTAAAETASTPETSDVSEPQATAQEAAPDTDLPEATPLETAKVILDLPVDKAGRYDQALFAEYQTRYPEFDRKIASMDARGMTREEIQEDLQDSLGFAPSPDLMDVATGTVGIAADAWLRRKLHAFYPVVYLETVQVKCGPVGATTNRDVFVAMAIQPDGTRDVLGVWPHLGTDDTLWTSAMQGLKDRGVQDILITVVGGADDRAQAIADVFPNTRIQACVDDLMRRSLGQVSFKDRKALNTALGAVYAAANPGAAESAMTAFEDSELHTQYPDIAPNWRAAWAQVVPFLEYPSELRRTVCTTKDVKTLNARIRRFLRTADDDPSDTTIAKLVYLALDEAEAKWREPAREWEIVESQLTHMFEARYLVA